MTERFYSIDHLTTQQLKELYALYARYGWTETEYFRLISGNIKPPKLSLEETILNIDANNEHNYFVLMNGCQDEEDGIIIGLGMSGYPDFAVYLHLPEGLLDELVLKYKLNCYKEAKNYTVEELLVEQSKGNPLN